MALRAQWRASIGYPPWPVTSPLPLPESLRPDLERGARFLEAHPPPGELVQCGVTGAHFYGFPSPDSDLDLKGVHCAPVEQLLGLDVPSETHDVLTDFEGLEHDLTSHELRRALDLLYRGNGNLLERFLSPFQLVDHPFTGQLAQLARGAISKRFHGHYRGFFGGMRREHEREPRLKSMLYSYRVALTGIHLLETGECVGDVRVLAPAHGFDPVLDAVEAKATAGEKDAIEPALDARLREGWPALEEALGRALDRSALPDEPPNRAEANRWLVQARMGGG